jgi:hypothetical protein
VFIPEAGSHKFFKNLVGETIILFAGEEVHQDSLVRVTRGSKGLTTSKNGECTFA